MNTILEDTKPSLSEKMKAEIGAVVADAVGHKAEIQAKIDNLNDQLVQKQELLKAAEAKVAEIDEQRQNLIAEGKGTEKIYKAYDAIIAKRNRLDDEIVSIEEKALPARQKELSDYQEQIKSAVHIALAKQREVVVAEMQDLFDRIVEKYGQWTDLCSEIQRQYSVTFLMRKMNPFMPIVLPDKPREAMHERMRFRIAKYSKPESLLQKLG